MDFRTLALSLLGGPGLRQLVPPEGLPLQETDDGALVHVAPGAQAPTVWWDNSTPLMQALAGYNTNLRPQQYGLQARLQAALAAPPSLLGGAFPLRGGFGQFTPSVLLDPSQVEWPAGRYGP